MFTFSELVGHEQIKEHLQAGLSARVRGRSHVNPACPAIRQSPATSRISYG